MWTNLLYLAPVAAILSMHETEKEEILQGPLQDEVTRLFAKTVSSDKLRIIPNKKLQATINVTYPAHSNLWTIMDGIIQRYHLILDIQGSKDNGGITIKMLEGPSWKR